jgi:hypothetical protein
MAKLLSRTKTKPRGRPRKDPTLIHLTLLPKQLSLLDNWISKQPDDLSRPEAIRRIVDRALISSEPRHEKQKAQKASELAGRVVEHIVDKSMPAEEQERRKRALIRGPREFRDIREDLPKPKRTDQ